MSVVAPRSGPQPEPVSPRLTKTLVHPDHDGRIMMTLFSPDGRWVLGSSSSVPSGGVQIWDARTGKQLRTLRLPNGSIAGRLISPYSLTLAPDGRTLFVPRSSIKTIPTQKDGKLVVRSEASGEILVWDLASDRQLPSLKHTPPRGENSLQLSPDGTTLLAAETPAEDAGTRPKRVLTLWDTRTRTHRHLLDGWWTAVFAPDGKSFAASLKDYWGKRSKLALFDVASGRERAVFGESHEGYFQGEVFSPDGRYLASLFDMRLTKEPSEVKLWDVAAGKEVGSLAAPAGITDFTRPGLRMSAFTRPAFSPDGRWLAAALRTGRVYLYDVAGRKLAWSRDVKDGWLRELAFSPDGRWLAVTAQDIPKDRRSGEVLSPFDVEQPRIFLFDLRAGGTPEVVVAPHGLIVGFGEFAFSPDGKTLALGGSGCVWLFDVSRPAARK